MDNQKPPFDKIRGYYLSQSALIRHVLFSVKVPDFYCTVKNVILNSENLCYNSLYQYLWIIIDFEVCQK